MTEECKVRTYAREEIEQTLAKYARSMHEVYEDRKLDNEMQNDAMTQRIDELLDIAEEYFI